jgi:hypothetical protein
LEVDEVAKRVVGVDTSHAALRALTWAAGQARLWLASPPLVHP